MEVSGCLGKRRLTTGTVGFGLAPRINAAGRLERAMMAVEMLTTDDAIRAQQIALELDRCNTRRQEVERKILDEARGDDRGLRRRGRPPRDRPGRTGLAPRSHRHRRRPAGRDLSSADDRPGAGRDIAQGSARSIPGFDLYEAIKDCSGGLLAFGGHAAAAGLKLASENFAAFARLFEERCRNALTPEQLERVLLVDAEVPLGVLSLRVVEEIDDSSPTASAIPGRCSWPPTPGRGTPRVVGDQKKHLQLRVRQGDTIMRPSAGTWPNAARSSRPAASCSSGLHPSINEWNNHREVQLEIKDFAVDAQGAVPEPRIARTAIPTA